MNRTPDPCWVLHDGRAGNRRQALALAEALGHVPRELVLAPRWRARWLAPRWMPGAERAFGPEFAAAWAGTPPVLAIGCGRQAALATRLLRTRGARAVQILDPRLDSRYWDLVVAPEHDGLRGDNVLDLLGSLHSVTPIWLARMRANFAAFESVPAPRTVLLLGGPTRNAPFGAADVVRWLEAIDAQRRASGGGLLVCGSPRTPPALVEAVRARVAGNDVRVWTGERDGPNPYPGALAWADRIVLSPDSVNMVSEACATRAPVFVAGLELARGRIRRFLDALLARGRIRPWSADATDFPVEPILETPRIAAQVRLRLGLPLEEAWRY